MSIRPGNLRTCRVALVATLLVLLAGCSDDSPGPTAYVGERATSGALPEPDPLAGAPALGNCYPMTRTAAAAVTHEGPDVDCSEPHTSMTYHVGRFASGSDVSDADVAASGCTENLAEGVGLGRKDLRSSILTYIWFEPSTEQWRAGARWYRCDVIAQVPGGPLKPLPESTPFFPSGVPDGYFRCMQERGEQGVPVTCDKAHRYRWAGTFEGKGAERPGQAKLLAQAEDHCYSITGTSSWWVTWPSAGAWASGNRTMDCFKRTRS
jgi:hypothetical protein